MRNIIASLLLLLVFGCNSTSLEQKSKKRSILQQADTYADSYEVDLLKSSTLMVKHNSQVSEAFILSPNTKWISYLQFNSSPYQQFVNLLSHNDALLYADAKKKLKVDNKVYFAEDCTSIANLLKQIKDTELPSYNKKYFSMKLDTPTYIYQYKTGLEGIEQRQLRVMLEDHPVVDLYSDIKKAIKNCPHPKAPPKL
ncbi:hypothetical protein [Kangiella shandongensis]|uniref:hypothetical protein n=1 Tax=Kangiella shandongensis TaxID=2763258 RepID=UPI001CBD34CA|nr:hypothetical protein [Kangiella shandongensis]